MSEVERLTVVWDANLAKLNDKLDKVVRQNKSAARSVESTWNKTTIGKPLGEALDGIAAKGPGAALGISKLGVAGLAAGVALGGLAVALGKAKEAMAFADSIGDTAGRLHVTTDALQEYREALRLAGGDAAGADQALESFSITLGNAQGGLKKAEKAFVQLGFTPAQVKAFKDTDEALRAVITKIGEISNPAQRDAIIERLGLGSMKQLIDGGIDAVDRLRDKVRAAGLVMDSELIRRAGQSQDEFETLSKVIDIELKSALVDLAPVLISIVGFFAEMARLTGEIVDKFRSIENRRTKAIQESADSARSQNTALLKRAGKRGLSPSERTVFEHNLDIVDRANAELEKRTIANTPSRPTAGRTLANVSGGGRSRSSDTPVTTFLPEVSRADPEGEALREQLQKRFEDMLSKEVDGFDAGGGFDAFKSGADDWITKAVEEAAAAAQKIREEYRDNIHDGILDGLHAAADGNGLEFLRNRLREALFEAAADGLTAAFLKAQSSAGGGFLGSVLKVAGDFLGFGGHRASGGPVSPGQLYKVGERGEEWFVPRTPGTIVPNDVVRSARGMGSGGSMTVVQQTIRLANYGPTTKEFMAEVQRLARTEANRAGAQSASFTLGAMPGRLVQQQKLGR